MISDWLTTDLPTVGLILLSGALVLLGVVALIRFNGLRSFSKMTSSDFAVTVAIGSIIATVTVTKTSLLAGVVGVAALLGTQHIVALLRRKVPFFGRLVDNTPLLLVSSGKILEDNLRTARVSRDDVYAKLREANCLRLGDAHAVVLEVTGDISVLHGGDGVDDALLQGVRR